MDALRFIELLKLSRLVDDDELRRFLGRIPEIRSATDSGSVEVRLDEPIPQSPSMPSGKELADRLVDATLLTRWQADKLLDGRHKGFCVGDYTFLQHLADGGTTDIYVAFSTPRNRLVALKILHRNRSHDAAAVQRFKFLGKVGPTMHHPNIIDTYEFVHEGSLRLITREYVAGRSLQTMVEERGPLPFAQAAQYAAQAAAGLHYLHQNGLVHRDLKPHDLLLDEAGNVKIVGFEHATFDDRDSASETAEPRPENLAVVDYLAPEHAVNSYLVDYRSDLYSLGCVLVYLLTGKPPFPAGNFAQKLLAHQSEPPPDLRKVGQSVPDRLAAVVATLLAKQPHKRFQSAAEVHDRLLPFIP